MLINVEVHGLVMFTNAVKKCKAILLFSHFIPYIFKYRQALLCIYVSIRDCVFLCIFMYL